MTASTGRTALAILAILSLLLSLFAIVRPAIAFDDVNGPAVTPTVQPGNPPCPEGTTEIKFEGATLFEGSELTVIIDGQEVTGTITNVNVAAGTFDFEVEGGLALVVIAKGGPNGNVYDYRPLGGAAHDDGLTTPINPNNGNPYGISHISLCVIPVIASIDVEKEGPEQSKVGDEAAYTVTITNDGDIELFIQSVDDTLAGDLTAAVVEQCGSLEVDEVCVFDYSYTVQEGDDDQLVNVVTVTATTGATGTGTSVTDDGTATVDLFEPGITVDKTGPAAAEVGDVITYTVTITNTSSSDSPNLVIDAVTDTLVGDLTAEAILECGELEPAEECVLTYDYTVTADSPDPIDNTVTVETHPDGFPNDIDDSDSHQVDVVEELGSITITKVIDCEICETFTPGFFFNRGENNAGTAFTNEMLPGNQVEIAGENFGDLEFDGETYDSAVQEINAYLTADRNGELDGEQGLSAQGQLVRQFLALYLNVLLAGEECDLASLIYTGGVDLPTWVDADEDGEITVQELLDAAVAAETETDMRAIAEAIDEVNNSGDGGPVVLDCAADTEGTTGAGFSFDLFGPDDETALADSGTTDGDGNLLLDGDPDGSGLPLGEYLLVEDPTNASGLECEIVDVTVSAGGSAVLNADGTVTITLTEEAADITLTVVNDCEEVVEEEEFGSIEIRKDADDDPDEEFSFSATWDADGFILTDGDTEFSGDLAADAEYTVTEVLTAQQIADGWSLEDIDCGDADVDDEVIGVTGGSVTITLHDGDNVICTFTNEQEVTVQTQTGSITIIKDAVPNNAQDFAFTTTGSGLSNFSLDDDADATLSNQRTFTGLAAGPYTVVETATTGWTLTSVTCSTGGTGSTASRMASITLAAGANVVCVFVNTQSEGTAGGGGGPAPTPTPTTSREGTLADTAMEPPPVGTPSVLLLALVMLTSSLTAAAYVTGMEGRRR